MSLRFEKGRHRYYLDGERVPGVTTVLGDDGLPKPHLKRWGERIVAEAAWKHREAVMAMSEREAVDFLKRAPYRILSEKAALGTAVHAATARYVRGDSAPSEGLSDGAYGYFNAALRYLKEQRVEVLLSECMVYSRQHRYAGTLDLQILARRRALDLAPVEINDFKTSKAVYPDVALQLVAYARAEMVVVDDHEQPMTPTNRGLIVRLDPSGEYEAVPAELSDDVWETFLHARGLYEWKHEISPTVLGEPLRMAA